MARMGELFTSTSKQIERTSIRTFYTNVDVVRGHSFESTARQYAENEFHQENNFQFERIRSPSLPPIERERPYKVMTSTEEDTSGYLSDLGTPQTPEIPKNTKRVKSRTRSKHMDRSKYYSDLGSNRSKGQQSHFVECNVVHEKSLKEEHNRMRYERPPIDTHALHRSEFGYGQGRKVPTDMADNEHDIDFSLPKYNGNSFAGGMPNNYDTPSSSSSGASCDVTFKVKEERAKWGDRGVTVGHFYDPMSRGTKKSEPSWLQKYEVDSPAEGSARSESYTRGQNTPIDPGVLAERLTKRQKALEFQNAIREQLLEQESRKKREQEKRLQEEKLEEQRLMRQIEIERNRLEEEQRQQQKKFECERKKQEVMMRALEQAEMDAKLEKDKKRREKGFTPKLYEKNMNADHINNVMEQKMIRQSDNNSASAATIAVDVDADEDDDADGGIGSADDEEDIGEKILIGTPINLKMKDLQKFRHVQRADDKGVNDPPTDMDGVALVLQSMPSGIPIPLTHDFLNLTNGFGNMPVIAMLAHQIQHFNEQNGALLESQPHPELISNDIVRSPPTSTPTTTKCNDNDPREQTNKGENDCVEQNKISCDKCIIVSEPSPCDALSNKSAPQFERKISVPHEGTFTKVVSRRDAATTMSTTKTSVHNDYDKFDVLVNLSFHEMKDTPTCDASTQTEDKHVAECDFCVRHHNCNQMDYLKEMSKAVSTIAEELKKHQLVSHTDNSDPAKKEQLIESVRSSTVRSKSKDHRPEKHNSERPKWGVNRPSAQYIKASERDPFYIRNRNRIRQKCYEVKCSEEKQPDEENFGEKITRNIGTQIFPIKTDGSGKIFLNFRESSFVIDEAQVKKNLRNKYTASSRRFNRMENTDKGDNRASAADKDVKINHRTPNDRVNLDVDLE